MHLYISFFLSFLLVFTALQLDRAKESDAVSQTQIAALEAKYALRSTLEVCVLCVCVCVYL